MWTIFPGVMGYSFLVDFFSLDCYELCLFFIDSVLVILEWILYCILSLLFIYRLSLLDYTGNFCFKVSMNLPWYFLESRYFISIINVFFYCLLHSLLCVTDPFASVLLSCLCVFAHEVYLVGSYYLSNFWRAIQIKTEPEQSINQRM